MLHSMRGIFDLTAPVSSLVKCEIISEVEFDTTLGLRRFVKVRVEASLEFLQRRSQL